MENKAISMIEIGKVYTLKIFSGEEIVSKVVQIGDGFLELEDPVSLAPSQTGMALVPSVFSASMSESSFIFGPLEVSIDFLTWSRRALAESPYEEKSSADISLCNYIADA